MNRYQIVFLLLLFIITITIITTIPILVNEDNSIMAQPGPGGPGVIPIDPENVTNQTLQGYPTEDKDMSTGIEQENE